MRSSGYVTMSPNDIEARFSEGQGLGFLGSIFTEPSEEAAAQIEQVTKILESLPPKEADFVDLYYFKHCKQTDIAAIFNVSQPTVCYRLRRAADRIKFLMKFPVINATIMAQELATCLEDPTDVKIMVLMYDSTCQSAVAKELGVSQGLVRHRFLRSLRKLKNSPRMEKYVGLFDDISQNLNILREVQKPNVRANIEHVLD